LRFFADGPWLPDELLVARDEGRVLFFCGAGVSRAQAGLPDFLGLAKSVLRELRVLPESPARKLVDLADRLDRIDGVGGIMAADRIFGLLEREFSVTDIERAVGAALKPPDKVDLFAHRTLLALSRDAGGKVQLVTTNFDRLFEAAAPRASVWTPNHLPDLRGTEGFEGVVHLHGMFDPAYDKPLGGNRRVNWQRGGNMTIPCSHGSKSGQRGSTSFSMMRLRAKSSRTPMTRSFGVS
jgi:hypothetical protein